ncbi:hypothetical protein [Streptomyces formicae]|nr:hypothetical protein [Streptomyces formicae]
MTDRVGRPALLVGAAVEEAHPAPPPPDHARSGPRGAGRLREL